MNMCDTFFGGRNGMRSALAKAATLKRTEMKLTPDDVDRRCMLGRGSYRCAEYEADPQQMTATTFRRVAFPLRLSVNVIDEVKTGLEQLQPGSELMALVLQDMVRNGVVLKGGCGKGDVRDVSAEKQAPVYVVLKALQEIG